MPESCGALVVGGGPAGTATALRLARLGHEVVLVDKARFPRDKCCSEYASPETLRELALLDVLPSLDARGWTRLTGTAVSGALGSRLHGRFADAGEAPFRDTGMALPRRELDALLLTAARDAGVAVREGYRLEGLDRDGNGTMHATVAGDGGREAITTRIVIGADGLGSRVARLAGLRQQGGLRRVAFVAHLAGVKGMQAHAELHVSRNGYVGLNPLHDDTTNVALVVPAAEAVAARGDATAFFQRGLAGFPAIADRLAQGRIVRDVLVTGPFDVRSTRSTADGIALVGDAAEFFDPFTGEGIWTALAGARLLSDTIGPLLRGTAPITDQSLAPYRRARRRRFAAKWGVERVIGHAMRWPGLFDAAIARIARAGLASTVIGITGDFVPPQRLLSPRALWRLAFGARDAVQRPALTTHDSRLTSHG
jgi:flavin-dependent dehydrogenase